MPTWFRLYEEVISDPKVQQLSDKLFKTWVNLLCLASKHKGILPSMEDMAFALRLSITRMQERIQALVSAELLEPLGDSWRPHNWDGRQYKSDDVTKRVQGFRERQRNVARNVTEPLHETPPDTEAEQTQNRADSDGDVNQLPYIALAHKIAEAISWTESLQPIAGAIRFCVEQEGKTKQEAVTFLLIELRRMILHGGAPDRFWFTDRKWRKAQTNGTEQFRTEGRGDSDDAAETAKWYRSLADPKCAECRGRGLHPKGGTCSCTADKRKAMAGGAGNAPG